MEFIHEIMGGLWILLDLGLSIESQTKFYILVILGIEANFSKKQHILQISSYIHMYIYMLVQLNMQAPWTHQCWGHWAPFNLGRFPKMTYWWLTFYKAHANNEKVMINVQHDHRCQWSTCCYMPCYMWAPSMH